MKYDHFSMLPERAFQPRNGRTGMTLEGGGGGGGHTTSTVTQSSIPDWLRPQTEALLGAATQETFTTQYNPATGGYDITGIKPYVPYSADPRDYIAPFTSQERAVMGEAAGMQSRPEFGSASALTGTAGLGALGLGEQAAGMGGMYERMATDPMSMQAYMSPYMQNVVEIQKQQAIEDAQRAQLGANLGAARQGTYGGARQTLAQAQREAALNKQLSDIQARGLQTAFDQARAAQQFGVTTGLQGLQTGIQGVGTAGQLGGQLADIGTAGQAADISRMGFQQQLAAMPREMQQRVIDQAISDYAASEVYGQQQLAAYNALLRGYSTPTTTQQTYQAQPSGLQQLAGLGTTAAGIGTIAGMGRKEGGVIKYAKGGITDTDAIESFAEDLSIPQLQQSMRSGELKGKEYIGMPILQNKVADAERMKMAQAMMSSQQGQQESISDALMAKADQLQGAEPVMAAGGGIVAFRRGGSTEEDEIERILAEAQAGRGPNVQRVPDDPAERQKVLQKVEDYRKGMNKAMGITDIVPPAPAAAPAPAMPQQGTPEEPKKDMATLLAEREAQQKAFLGEDPSIKKMRESLAKQGEDTLLDRILRGSQMVFAGEQLRTRGDTAGLEKVIAGEAKRAESAAEREAKLAELEGADYRRRADIYKEVAGEERKKAETASERAFQEKVLERKLQVEKELARMKPASASEYIGNLLRSKDRKEREVGKMLLGQSKTGAMTRKDAAEMVLKANPTLAFAGKEQELEDAINRIMSTLGGGSGGGFKVLGRE